MLAGLMLPATHAGAQTSADGKGAGIIAPGDAVVTGFSGIKAPDAAVPPGADPLDAFHIDLDGASAQVFQLTPAAPPQGQVITAPAPYKALARDVGQVFPIALDDAPVPNIYLGQSSAFGLQIVGPDRDGDGRPDRLRNGAPEAQWMPGQLGNGGGPGSIYRIDGRTGALSVLATIPGNGGAGLGDIVFDKASRHFYVSDLDTGLIHRLDADGHMVDSFDHGTTGRKAAGLPPVSDDGAQANIKDARFSVENPQSWGFTAGPRRVWGMAVHDGRLYYAVADGPAIWSVGIGNDGAFAGDARLELEVEDTPEGHAIADIAFDAQGRMYLAQRGEIRGSYDYSVFAEPGKSVLRRYRRKADDDAAAWEPVPEEYAIGFPEGHRNTAGGIALGYGYDTSGSIRRGSCHSTLWTTGDALRNDEKHLAKLGDEGPLEVHGLQGNDVALVRPQNAPPFQSYFVDYDGQFGDAGKAGHVGDVEIWQPCEGSPGFSELYPGYPPQGYVWVDDEIPPLDRRRSNLKIKKRPLFCWAIGGGKHRCAYRITVTNTGPHSYHGHIEVQDTIPDLPGVTATFSSAKFTCGGGAPSYTCKTKAPEHLAKFEQVIITVRVDVPNSRAKALHCRVRNHARILFAPGGSRRNTDPADDTDTATAQLPKHLCEEPPTNLRLTNWALGDCVPSGGGYRCDFLVRVRNTGPSVYNDKLQVTDTIPAGTTATFPGAWNCMGGAPSYQCGFNALVLNPPAAAWMKVSIFVSTERAKQLNCKVTNKAKIDHAPGGSFNNTNPGDDQAWATANIPAFVCTPPVPATPCPPGFWWSGDRCARIVIGDTPPPTQDCPAGTHGRYPYCQPFTITTPVCPAGTYGNWPNCRRRVCPTGTFGDWPHCRRRVCQSGTYGTWPNCRRRVTVQPTCPPGKVGRPPRCRTVVQGLQSRTQSGPQSNRQNRVQQYLRKRR